MLPTVAALLSVALWPACELQGHRTFRVREAATAHLSRLGLVAYPALARGADSPDPEAAARCRRLLAKWEERDTWELAGQLLPRGCKRLPWIDLGGDTQAWVTYAEARGAPAGGPGNSWENYRLACRLWVQRQLREYRSPDEIRFDLAVMAEVEAEWTWNAVRGQLQRDFLCPVRVPSP